MPRHIRDFSALCGAKFESQLGKCTENNKRNRPKLGRNARKFFVCGITIQFEIYYSYSLVVEKSIKKMWLLLRMLFAAKCYFFGFKSSYFGAPFIWPWLFDVKFWEAMGEEISIHTVFFFVWHCKYYFFHLSCNQLPQLWNEMQIRLFKPPTGI